MTGRSGRLYAAATGVALLIGCTAAPPVPPRIAAPAPPVPIAYNWPAPPLEAERLLAHAPVRFTQLEATSTGVSGAYRAHAVFPSDGRELDVKWKPALRGDLDGWNNNPRKELAAWALQALVLAPEDDVVPATALRCLPLAEYAPLHPGVDASLPDTTCVLGAIALWLRHVQVPARLYDPDAFAADGNAARRLATFNVLAVLMQHQDGRPGNILVSDDPRDRRVFAVDNGISFGALIYNFLTTNWDVMRVPAIPADLAHRLRTLDPARLRSLATIAELRTDASGVLVATAPEPPIDPDRGVRTPPGRLQLGLTTAEIAGVTARLAHLVRMLDRGELATFGGARR